MTDRFVGRIPHVPALDGIRGVAVAAVLVYHGRHLTGGWLVRVDPTTAEVDHLWTYTGASPEQHYGLARSGGLLYVMRDSYGAFFAWNGSSLVNSGQSSSPFTVGGATAIDAIPEPTSLAIVVGALLLARRHRSPAASHTVMTQSRSNSIVTPE